VKCPTGRLQRGNLCLYGGLAVTRLRGPEWTGRKKTRGVGKSAARRFNFPGTGAPGPDLLRRDRTKTKKEGSRAPAGSQPQCPLGGAFPSLENDDPRKFRYDRTL
jgi:hypothetical protein